MDIKSTSIELEDILLLRAHAPIISGLFQAVLNNAIEKPKAVKSLKDFCELLLKIHSKIYDDKNTCFTKEISLEEYEIMLRNLESFSEDKSRELVECWDTGYYFPYDRVYRTVKEVQAGNNCNSKEEKSCNKIYKKKGILAPGVLLFFCLEHQQCLGFIVLEQAESLKIVTETILTRFVIIPQIIVYDNSCNLESYALARYPKSFMNTKFLVDKFHFRSHSECANTYDSGRYSGILSSINTSMLEQKNSRIACIKKTAPYLNVRSFSDKLAYMIRKLNEKAMNSVQKF